MEFRLAVAGVLTDEQRIVQLVNDQISVIRNELSSGKERINFQILLSPSYTDLSWKKVLEPLEIPIGSYCRYNDSTWDDCCTQIIREDTPLRSMLGEEICDKADMILLLWNEDVAQMDGAIWELLQLTSARNTPCIWVSSETGHKYWAKNTIYEWYKEEYLQQLVGDYRLESMEPYAIADSKNIPFLRLGMWLRSRYLKKYKALGGKVDAQRDLLMDDDYTLGDGSTANTGVRDELLAQFHRYDDAAIELNNRYQAVIYWRAILPFITSIFLAIGFYAENVLGVIAFSGAFWKVVAGVGFLIHGLLNLYVYSLSRSETIKKWHRGFLQDRYMAEVLRVLIHFEPFGINLNLRKLCGGNRDLYMTVRRMTGKSKNGTREISKAAAKEMLDHVEQMLEDQIAYHTISARRYEGMVNKLENWYKIVFGAGFIAVVLRALLQFVWVLWPITSGELNGIAMSKFSGSFANMVALMLPGWASYFSTKLSQCNFRYNLENHQRMITRLEEELTKIRQMRRSVTEIPLEALNGLGEELAQTMLIEDTYAWYRQVKTITVKHL